MGENISIIDTSWENILEYGVCGYKSMKRPGYPEKIEWLKDRFQEGLKIKTLYSEKDGTQGAFLKNRPLDREASKKLFIN
jgi:hypothetical protein